MNWFKFLPCTVGSGWIGAYVAVDQYLRPRDLADTQEICLSFDCQDAQEFEQAIDELIEQLNALKQVARHKFENSEIKI